MTLVSPVPSFDVDQPYPARVAGVACETYLGWMRTCHWISATGLPASVPLGFTDDRFPVGLQIVGRPGADVEVLQLVHAVEPATGTHHRAPAIARVPHDTAATTGPGPPE